MPLQSFGFADLSQFDAQVAPTSGRTCPSLARRCDIQHPYVVRMLLLSAVIHCCELALSLQS